MIAPHEESHAGNFLETFGRMALMYKMWPGMKKGNK
jgi:hypothetical protein